MRAKHLFAQHGIGILAALAVLALAWAASERAAPPNAQAVSTGPAPLSETGLSDACSRRVGCLRR